MSPEPVRYTRTAIALHWLLAALMIANLAFGFFFVDLPFSPQKLRYFSWHKWAGMVVLPFAAALLIWRALRGRAPPDARMAPWERHASSLTHALLYISYFAVPLTGWLFSSAEGFQTVLFGVIPIPDLLSKDKALAATLKGAHVWVSYLMAAAALLHASAALKHHFANRDDVLARMLPLLRPRS